MKMDFVLLPESENMKLYLYIFLHKTAYKKLFYGL